MNMKHFYARRKVLKNEKDSLVATKAPTRIELEDVAFIVQVYGSDSQSLVLVVAWSHTERLWSIHLFHHLKKKKRISFNFKKFTY